MGTHQFTDTIFDANGNFSICDWSITVLDTIAPMIVCPASYSSTYVTGQCGADVSLNPPDSLSDNCTSVAWTSTHGDGLWLPDTVTVTYTAIDPSGNTSACSFVVISGDYEAPLVTCPPTIELTAGASCKAAVPNVTGMATSVMDNCTSSLSLLQDLAVGSLVQTGDIIHIYTTDAWANVGQCPMTVVTIDNDPPVFDNCPGPGTIVLNTDPNSCEHLYTFPTIESSDNCDADTESDYRAFILESGNTLWQEVTGQLNHAFAPGLHQIMEIHRDDSGNQDTCAWSVNVVDSNAPSISCPAFVAQLNAGANCTVSLPDYTLSATVAGNCSGNTGVVVSQSPAPGASVGTGTVTVTLTATQGGLSANCAFSVSIVDATPPAFANCPGDISMTSVANTCGATATWTPPTVIDNCPGATIVQTDGQAPGSTFAIGTHAIEYTATDAAGLQSTCSFEIEVTDDDAPTVACPLYDEYPLLLSGPGCSLVFPDLRDSITVSDCSAWTNTMTPAPGTVFNQDTLVNMTMWIEDAFGNGLWNNHTIRIAGQTSDTTAVSACDSYIWAVDGNTYTASGSYAYTLGCHTETLDLTITPSTSNHSVATACNSYTWAADGIAYTASGSYSHIVGCHTETLELIIIVPGTPCDDGDPTTGNDVYGADCSCAGQLIDCTNVPGGAALPGTPCDDGDPTTGNDAYDLNCNCVGVLIDCTNVPGGAALPGTPCDDGDPTTGNDAYDLNCNCVGVLIDCANVPGGAALPGTPCDDGDPATGNDVYGADCSCAGQLIDCTNVPGGAALPGTPCDDGDPTTGNDVYGADCSCAGQLIDCTNVPGGAALPGTPCDDGDPTTGNDAYDLNCNCVGVLIDCTNVPGGSALPGTPCDDGDPPRATMPTTSTATASVC
ncbi:MAG: HYR domain-containing protein [Flavobacteriales bacterium]|nr:HYR domain-containing protein [Flavobacteriales bacterium]